MGLQDALSTLHSARVYSGDPATVAARSDVINALIDAVKGLARGENIGTGVGIRKVTGPGTVNFSSDPRGLGGGGGAGINCSFRMVNATEVIAEVESNKVKIFDGKINGGFPSGMGFGNYVFDLPSPEDQLIYAAWTVDFNTLNITSRYMDAGTNAEPKVSKFDQPNNQFIIYKQIGFTYFSAEGVFTIWQTYLGDIDAQIYYGVSGQSPYATAVSVMSNDMALPITP